MPTSTLDQWLSTHAPAARGGTAAPAPGGPLATLLAPLAAATHAEGGAALVGTALNSALEADDDARQSLPVSGGRPDQDPEFIETFVNAPATGLSTLLDMARAAAGWDPLAPDDPVNVARFRSYVAAVETNPLFHLTLADTVHYERRSQDWSKVISDIADLFDGVESEDRDKIKKSLVGLAEAATSRTDTRQTTNLFAQNTIQAGEDELEAYIYASTVTFVEHNDKSDTRQQEFTIKRVRFAFQTKLWNEVTATSVAQHHFKSLLDWLDRFNTKQGDQPQILTCFR